MNNERYEQIIYEAYQNYVNQNDGVLGRDHLWTLKKEEFINKCKTDQEFSERWGLKIEERELSLEERLRLVNYDKQKFSSIDEWIKWYENEPNEFYYLGINYTKDTALTDLDVPTKLITITYNDIKIKSYE